MAADHIIDRFKFPTDITGTFLYDLKRHPQYQPMLVMPSYVTRHTKTHRYEWLNMALRVASDSTVDLSGGTKSGKGHPAWEDHFQQWERTGQGGIVGEQITHAVRMAVYRPSPLDNPDMAKVLLVAWSLNDLVDGCERVVGYGGAIAMLCELLLTMHALQPRGLSMLPSTKTCPP